MELNLEASRITASVNDGAASATVRLEQSGQAAIELRMDADGIDDAIRALASARDKLQPSIPEKLELGDRVAALVDPAWNIDGQTRMGLKMLSFRHPGLGWQTFGLPVATCASMAGWLLVTLPEANQQAAVRGG